METNLPEQEKYFPASLISDMIIGISDGLVVPFAFCAGLSAMADSTALISTAGLAVSVAGAIPMGFGGYISIRSEQKSRLAQTRTTSSESAQENSKVIANRKFFANLGLSEEMQDQAMLELSKDEDQWSETMKKYQRISAEQAVQHPFRSALVITLSYFAGGLVSVLPYFFVDSTNTAIQISLMVTIFGLLVFGWLKAGLPGAFRAAVIGIIAAGAAYGVAKIIEGA